MAEAQEPSVLGLIIDSQNRIEGKVDAGFAEFKASLAGKADKSDLAEIRGEMKGHNARIENLEHAQELRDARGQVHRERNDRTWKRWQKVAAGCGGILGLVAAVTDAVARLTGH